MRSLLLTLSALLVPLVAHGQSSVYLTENTSLGVELRPYDARVSAYSPIGANNQFTTGGGRIVAEDGTYLGRLNANQFDPESVANPFGQYGSPYSPTSVNNPYSAYGSPWSPQSATNPYTTTPPVVEYDNPW